MSKQNIVIYVLSFLFFPVTALILLLSFWTIYPGYIKKRTKQQNSQGGKNG